MGVQGRLWIPSGGEKSSHTIWIEGTELSLGSSEEEERRLGGGGQPGRFPEEEMPKSLELV